MVEGGSLGSRVPRGRDDLVDEREALKDAEDEGEGGLGL